MTEYYLYGDHDGNALDRLKASRPQLISKLYYWARKRYSQNIRHSLCCDDIAKKVDLYLEAIAFASGEDELRETLDNWNHLSPQEKAIVGKFFPFKLPRNIDYPSTHIGGWFLDTTGTNLAMDNISRAGSGNNHKERLRGRCLECQEYNDC